MDLIKILVVQPTKQPYVKEIKNNIDSIYGLVYYPYQEIEIEKDIYLIYSKEGKINNFPLCRKFKGLNIYSNFVVVKRDKSKFISLNDKDILKYSEIFEINNK